MMNARRTQFKDRLRVSLAALLATAFLAACAEREAADGDARTAAEDDVSAEVRAPDTPEAIDETAAEDAPSDLAQDGPDGSEPDEGSGGAEPEGFTAASESPATEPEPEFVTTPAEAAQSDVEPTTPAGDEPADEPAPAGDAASMPPPEDEPVAAGAETREEEPAVSDAAKVPEPVAGPGMDLEGLEKRLRSTKAIGLFTKLELKNQVEALVDDFADFHNRRSKLTLVQLEERFDLLVMKLLLLLQDEDPRLHSDIAQAKPTLWTTLANPDQFESLRGP